jgi:hypothetical protein
LRLQAQRSIAGRATGIQIKGGIRMTKWSAKAEVENVDSPEESQKLINEAVNKILEKYPPAKR